MTTHPPSVSQTSDPKLDSNQLSAYAQILRSPMHVSDLPAEQQSELLLMGIIVALHRDGSEQAVSTLAESVLACPVSTAQDLALFALQQLAQADNAAARKALYSLAIEQGFEPAFRIIRQGGFRAEEAGQQALFELLAGDVDAFRALDPRLERATQAYLEQAGPDLRKRLLAAAERAGLNHWSAIITTAQEASPEKINELVQRYPGFPPVERDLAIQVLDHLAQAGQTAAQDAICLLFVHYEDEPARTLAVQRGYSLREPIQRALFLFLSEQWRKYESYDFDQRLLVAAYETAEPTLRKRVLDLSRRSGQVEWFQSISGANRMRWLNDLSDADWDNAVRYLGQAGRWEDLWRLAQVSSPLWSARILAELERSDWQPARSDEINEQKQLLALSREALRNPLSVRPYRSFNIPTVLDDLTALALSPDGKSVAIGTSSNAIHVWQIADVPTPLPVLHGAAAQTRALAFSPDGEFLVASVGDNTMRVYRWQDGKEVKMLKGHEGLVRSLAISPDGRVLYTASFDGTIRAWRFPFGPEISTIHRTEGEIFGVALNPSGDLLVSAGADRVVQVFQLPEGNIVREMSGHGATITNLVTAPSSDFAASYSRDRTIRVWNYVSGREMQVIDDQLDVVTGLCIHPNEHVLVSAGYKGKIILWNISTSTPLVELTSHRRAVTGLAISPDGSLLVSASADAAVTIWNLEHFLLIRQPVENMPADRGERIRQQLEHGGLLPNEKKWLNFTLELIRWKQRFDVEIEGPRRIEAGEFDIQL